MKRLSFLAAACGLALTGASLSASAAQAAPAAEWQPNDDDALLLALRSGNYRVGDALRGYQTPGGVCVDLADLIQALDLPVRLDKKSRRATGWLFAEEQTFVLDREQNTVQTMNNTAPVGAGEVHDAPEGWCIEAASLSRWFGVSFKPDLSNATLLLASDKPLPFLEAIERKSRAARLRPSKAFDLSLLPQADLPYRAWRAPSVDAVLKLGVRREPLLGVIRETRYELYSAGELAGASFESRTASDTLGRPSSLRLRAFRNDPEGGLLGPLKATQVAAGDVTTFAGALTGQSAVGRGLFISNRPMARPSSFSATTLRGALPAGWDAEVYRNGQLLGFQEDRGDGRYAFDVDLLFGPNAFEVVLYGPQGQIRRENSNFPIGGATVPAGKTFYWAEFLEQGRDLVDLGPELADPHVGWRWGVGVERGIDRRTSLGLSAQSLMLEGARRNYLEARVQRALGPMLVELSGAQQLAGKARGGRALRGAALGELAGVAFEAETTWVFGGFTSELVDADQAREHRLRLDRSFKLGGVWLPVQLGARHAVSRNGQKVTEVLTRLGIHARRMAVTAELSRVSTSRLAGAPVVPDETRLTVLANAGVGKVRVRGESRFRLGADGGFEAARVVGEVPLTERSDLRLVGEYNRMSGRKSLGAGYVRQFDAFSLRADADLASDGSVGAGLQLAFSFGPDPLRGGLHFSNEKLAMNGEAAVSVWRDEDANGRRDPGEEAVEGVEIGASLAKSTPTDASGQALVTGLRPFQPIALAIDTGSLEDPFLMPASQGVVVTPRPGIAARIDIPLVPTGEVEAALLDGNGDPLEGVLLELIDTRGAATASARSEFDGFVLFEKVPYGAYRVRIAAESAAALSGAPDVLGSAKVDRAQPVARLGRILLQRATRIAAAP